MTVDRGGGAGVEPYPNAMMADRPRRPLGRRSPIFALALIILIPDIALLALITPDALKAHHLYSRGVPGIATVLGEYVTHSKSGPNYHVRYTYALTDRRAFKGDDTTSRSASLSLSAGSPLPILVDPYNPRTSAQNIGDKLRAFGDPGVRLIRIILPILAISNLIMLGVVVPSLLTARRRQAAQANASLEGWSDRIN